MTHDQLCERALKWLTGTMRCNPTFSRNASCAEIPDAIGWTSKWKFYGSIVVECKTSHNDFLADKKKAIHYRHPDHHSTFHYSGRRLARSVAKREGYIEERIPRMGDFRFFMCEGLTTRNHIVSIGIQDIQTHAPDHGLLYVEGRRVRVIVPAPRRNEKDIDYQSEIRYLRFAIINGKTPFERLVEERTGTIFSSEQTRPNPQQ